MTKWFLICYEVTKVMIYIHLYVCVLFISVSLLQKETPHDHILHKSAYEGNLKDLKYVLNSGRVHIDCIDKVSFSISI